MSTVSIIIRTKNEAKDLPACLGMIRRQTFQPDEIIVVDSGSTDETLNIAQTFDCKIISIPQEVFTFGYALNIGIQHCTSVYAVAISAHCLPADEYWLEHLVTPFAQHHNLAGVYGRQVPFSDANPIERRGLAEAYPAGLEFVVSDSDLFSNANSILNVARWKEIPFEETLTGAEDIHWCTQMKQRGYIIGYEPRATVFHSHQETIRGVHRRSWREAEALVAINSRFVKKHSAVGYGLRCVRSMILDQFFLIFHPISFRYFLQWTIRIPLYRIAIYYGQYQATRKIHR